MTTSTPSCGWPSEIVSHVDRIVGAADSDVAAGFGQAIDLALPGPEQCFQPRHFYRRRAVPGAIEGQLSPFEVRQERNLL